MAGIAGRHGGYQRKGFECQVELRALHRDAIPDPDRHGRTLYVLGSMRAVLVAADGLEWHPHRLVAVLGFPFSASPAAEPFKSGAAAPLAKRGSSPKLPQASPSSAQPCLAPPGATQTTFLESLESFGDASSRPLFNREEMVEGNLSRWQMPRQLSRALMN